MSRWKGSLALAFSVADVVTGWVEKSQRSVVQKSLDVLGLVAPIAPVASKVDELQAAVSRQIYGAIQSCSDGAQALLEGAIDIAERVAPTHHKEAATPLRSDAAGSTPWLRDNAQCVVNGFFGDHLRREGNALDLGMSLIHEGRPVAITPDAMQEVYGDATSKLCVFVHGLSATEWSWSLYAERLYGDPGVNMGTMLAQDLGYTPLYVRYNTGLHISRNGKALSGLLEQLVAAYPHPIEELVLIGHSMGGLVVRSAAYYGQDGAIWLASLRHVICLGSPHLGAPLEKGAHLLGALLGHIDTPATQICADILNARSAGIKDLRFGYTLDEEWEDEAIATVWLEDARINAPLLDGVGYTFFSATITKDPEHPLGQWVGDFLVRPPSAAGMDPTPARRIPFHSGFVLSGMNHLQLVNHPDVYVGIKATLGR